MENSDTDIRESSGPIVVEDVEVDPSADSTGRAERPEVIDAPDTRIHWILLALSITILTLSFVLRVPGQERVILPWINYPLPGLCYTRELLGIPCPGCGMTRCFISLAHGEFMRALQFNSAGVVLFGFVVCQIPYRLAQIWRIGRGQRPFYICDITWPVYMFLAIMVIQWIIKLVGHFV